MDSQFINYAQPTIPLLKNMAIVPIVAILMTQSDVKKEIEKLMKTVKDLERRNYGFLDSYDFRKIEEIILNKLTLLCIPKELHAEILDFVKPIGLQLTKCYGLDGSDYTRFYNAICYFKGRLYWSSRGTIDKIRAIEHLVYRSSQESDEGMLFGFAAEYCIENCVFELWKRFPKNRKEGFLRSSTQLCYISLSTYWSFPLGNKIPDLRNYINHARRKDSIHCVMLEIAILRENYLAFKYFWNKLTEEERIKGNEFHWLEHFMKENNRFTRWHQRPVPSECTDIMLFLLSQLSNQTLQKCFFKKYPELILKALYNHWSYQVYFLPTINEMWDFLDDDIFLEIISVIAAEADQRKSSRELLRKLWYCCPEKFMNQLFITKYVETVSKLIGFDGTGIISKGVSKHWRRQIKFSGGDMYIKI